MSQALKSDLDKDASGRGISTMTETGHSVFSRPSATFSTEMSDVCQLAESMRKSVDTVTDLLVRSVVEETRARYVAEASLRLLASTDEETTFGTLANLFVPTLADGAWIVSLHGTNVHLRAATHVDPAKEELVSALAKCFVNGCEKTSDCVERIFREGKWKEWSGTALREMLASLSESRVMPESANHLEFLWLEGWPLVVKGSVVGAIFLFGNAIRHESDMAGEKMLQSLAHCASLAVDNARVHEKSRQSIRAREHLMAMAAHDLRNFLSLAVLSLSTFDMPTESSNGMPSTSRLALVRKGLARMQRLVEDLLDFSSVEAGHLSIAPTQQNVALLIEEAVESFREAATQKNIRLVGRTPEAPCQLEGDAFRLLQVFSNLIGNALKFTPAGGSVVISAIDCENSVEFSVADTGCGIGSNELPQIFEAYRRTTRVREGGVGLGLSIAKGIVESHGGTMHVESRVGEGTTFSFRLPKKQNL